MPLAAAAGIAAIGTIGGAAIGASATKKAANTAANAQLQAAQQNNALQREIYNRNTGNIDPFMQRGNEAANGLQAFLGFAPAEQQITARNAFQAYLNNSNFSFANQEMERGLAAKLSASGGIGSGAGQKALARYQQDLQSGYRDRYFDLLSNQQNVGLSGANALTGVGTNYANAANLNNQNAANATSNAALLRGTANAGLYSAAGNALGQFAGQAFGSSFGNSWNPAKDQWV